MIVGFATPKGGAGKSTSCLALAGAAIERNSDIPVTLIDLDSQRAMERFCEKRAYNNLPAFNVSCKYMAECSDYRSIHELALSENEKGGLVLLDLPGHASDFNLLSAAIADIVVIPSALNTDEIYLGMNYLYMLMDYAQNSEWRLSSSFLLNRIPSVQSAASKSAFPAQSGCWTGCRA